ncbi:carboxypeptidase-like regulatory domain-containing protein [Cupriavidus lacunae]|uniref:Carboxypeptidase regulatory-like domain-containing protein n=1 Tax=Cupriavidus lacunae TaxID=2666307 RepID=A0A370NLB1_9BURK|nr:carboxypeptidase-like regulatory domain-containing protein [Cupriavidus lacunae]RDK06386.1 carboxypeptidase regulatory-like domain-containing protein [Cupriavidus lacunae]
MPVFSRSLRIALSSLVAAVSAAGCATGAATSGGDAPVQIMEQHGITYVSGGDDDAGRQAMQTVAARFNVRLLMVDAGRGRPLGGATVVVARSDGRAVLNTTASGPLFYMQLKPGFYRLAVGYQGRDQMRDIVVNGQPLDITFPLPVNTLEDDWLFCATATCPRR